jgi:hypothetical protein
MIYLPPIAVPLIIFAVGAGVALYARWYAKHDLADTRPPK